jgi:internalin A
MKIINILELLDQTGYQTFSVLLGFTWQMTVLIAAAVALTFVLRNHRASIRRIIWISAIMLIPLLPILSTLVSNVGIPQTPVITVQSYNMAERASMTETVEKTTVDLHENEASGAVSTNIATGQKAQPFSMLDYPWALGFMAYILGCMGFLMLAVLGHIRIARWIYSAVPSTNAQLKRNVEEAKSLIGMSKKCAVLESDCVSSPIVVGVLQPQIIFPRQLMDALSADEIRSILHHELAHVKRNDPAILSCISLFSVFFYFHPLFWYAYRQIMSLSEHAADDMVLDLANQPVGYAKLLSRLAEYNPPGELSTNLVTGFCLSRHVFIKRIEAILSRQRSNMRKLTGAALTATLVSMLAAIMFVVIVPLHQEQAIAQTAPASEISSNNSVSLEERVINFPESKSIGQLKISDPIGESFDEIWGAKWALLGPAQGKVTIPAGKDISLEINDLHLQTDEDKRIVLSALSSLAHDDLHTLNISTTKFTDEDFNAIQGLTSLREFGIDSGDACKTLSITGSGFKHLSKMNSLLSFSCLFSTIQDESLAYLKPIKTLRYISFWGNKQIRGEGLHHFQALPDLSKLSLYCCPIENVGLSNLVNCNSLEFLELSYTNITDDGLSHLAKLPALKELMLPEGTTAKGLRHLSGMSKLEKLSLQTRLEDSGFSYLTNLPNLKSLSLNRNTAVSDEGLKDLSGFSSLESISIDSNKMTGEGLKYLKSIPALKEVSLNLTMINDEGMQYLSGLPITGISLRNTVVTDRGLEAIKDLVSLKSISLQNTAITDAGMQYFANLKNLEYVRLRDTKITSEGLKYVKNLSVLKSLVLYGTAVGDKGLEYLKNIQSLSALNLCKTKITDDGLAHLSSMPSLRSVILAQTEISDEGIVHLKKMKTLESLNIQNTKISEEGAKRLQEFLPGCNIRYEITQAPPTKKSFAQPKVKAPAIQIDKLLQAPDGAEASWEALKGKVVVLDFWATWCGPCVKSLPHINELARKMADKPVQFIMVTGEEEDVVKDFLKKTKITPWIGIDSDKSMYNEYIELSGVSGIPLTVVVDQYRKVVSVSRPDQVTEETINKLLEK